MLVFHFTSVKIIVFLGLRRHLPCFTLPSITYVAAGCTKESCERSKPCEHIFVVFRTESFPYLLVIVKEVNPWKSF